MAAVRWRPREQALALAVAAGLAAVVLLAQVMDARRPVLKLPDNDAPVISPDTARRLALGFEGLAADWYWLRSLQYIGRKIEEQAKAGGPDALRTTQLDRITAVDPRVLEQLLDMTTTLDPRFAAVYEYAAVVLPAVEVGAAVRLLEKGIRNNPEQWYLHQQLAYIHWQREDYEAAGAAFRRGAALSNAKWMEGMARQMTERGADRAVARQMYARMYEESRDDQVRDWALKRLMMLRWLDERDAIRPVLGAWAAAHGGRCPAWPELAERLRAVNIRIDPGGVAIDPSGTRYVLAVRDGVCDVILDRDSPVPAR